MRHGSLFSGIGGFDLAAQWIGWENVFQVEIDDYCTKILEKNFPNATRYRDIREFGGKQYQGTIDVVSGGFPCQPFSVAGKRKGKEDDRYLWPEMFRVLREIKSTWIVSENVAGIIQMELDNMLNDLESIGYETQTFLIPAASVDARHRRNRIWIVAYSNKQRRPDEQKENGKSLRHKKQHCTVEEHGGKKQQCRIGKPGSLPYSYSEHSKEHKRRNKLEKEIGKKTFGWCDKSDGRKWTTEPNVGRVAYGVPHRVDRLKGLGNAIVPQVAYEIFRAIQQVDDATHSEA